MSVTLESIVYNINTISDSIHMYDTLDSLVFNTSIISTLHARMSQALVSEIKY